MIFKKEKFDYKTMNITYAKILYNFIISEIKDRNNYSFNYAFPDIKFVDLIQYKMNNMLESDVNSENLHRLIQLNEIHSVNKNNIISLDLNFNTNSIIKSDSYYNKIIKDFNPKVYTQGKFFDKSLKNNILTIDGFVKNLDHKFVMKNLANCVEEKIKQKYF